MSTEDISPVPADPTPADPQVLIERLEVQLGEQKDLAAARLLIAAVLDAFGDGCDE